MTTDQTKERVSAAASLLQRAAQTIRILTHISWPQGHRQVFLKDNCYQLPAIEYPSFDVSETLLYLTKARALIQGDSNVDKWLSKIANRIESGSRLLTTCGTPGFLEHSRALYGLPTDPLRDEKLTSLNLANNFTNLLKGMNNIDVGAPSPACHLATYVAERMTTAVDKMFVENAPSVEVVDSLSANALAGPKRIRLRRDACFTDKDIQQLIHHEAYIHVATSLNGIEQTDLRILGSSHPGSTKTQEGLAVFAEFITGSMDIDRFRRLADRVIAIQMALEGADFVDVFRHFVERVDNKEQAFENARRVFRGGTTNGGVPFTKDIVYLDGLLRVHSFLRTAVASGRSDCLLMLFCGKLDIEDIPVLCELVELGLCKPPKYLPPWAADRRFLISYLAYSSFLNGVDLSAVRSHYEELLSSSPVVNLSTVD